jgi:hypothetical protein
MANMNGTDGDKRSVSSLGELSRNVTPPRDLWPSIAAQIATADPAVPAARTRHRPSRMQWAALAAVVAALAVGVWLGRSVLPGGVTKPAVSVAATGTNPAAAPAGTAAGTDTSRPENNGGTANIGAGDPQALQASLVTDPRYTMRRAAMIRDLETQLKTLPPETQEKVASSLSTIRSSIKDLQDALGKDPANALLQELLVNSYQDEMRVLTAVHEASSDGRGI